MSKLQVHEIGIYSIRLQIYGIYVQARFVTDSIVR